MEHSTFPKQLSHYKICYYLIIMIESGEESLRISNNDSQKRILWLSENQTEVYLNQIKSRITEKIKPETCTKTLDDCKLIEGCLYNHFIFYNLSEPEMYNILMTLVKV